MATEDKTETPNAESPEAQARKTIAQRDEKIAELERQLDASRKMNQVERVLRKNQVPEAELESRIELLSPHLPEIPVDGVEEALNADKFKPLVSAPAPSNGNEGDGETTSTTPTEPDGGFGNQPSPGGDHQPVAAGKVGPGDDEYEAARQAAMKGDHSKMQKLYDDDRVQEPSRTW